MNGSRLRAISGAAAAVLCVALLGCGEKSEPATTGPVVTSEEQGKADIQAAQSSANAFLISSDAAVVCDQGITPSLLKKTYGDRKGCLKARKPASLAKSVMITSSEIDGDGVAIVSANAEGGPYGKGEKVTMTVLRDGAGNWRVSAVKSDAKVGP